MKKYFVLLFLMLSLSSDFIFAQQDKTITGIRAEVNAINRNLTKYKKKTKNVEDISLEGTEATFYASGKDLKKVSAKMYGETYYAAADFYYKNDKLIFTFVRFDRFDKPIALGKIPKVAKTEEKRLYFVDGKLEKLLVGKIAVKSSSEQWQENESDIVGISQKLRAAF